MYVKAKQRPPNLTRMKNAENALFRVVVEYTQSRTAACEDTFGRKRRLRGFAFYRATRRTAYHMSGIAVVIIRDIMKAI